MLAECWQRTPACRGGRGRTRADRGLIGAPASGQPPGLSLHRDRRAGPPESGAPFVEPARLLDPRNGCAGVDGRRGRSSVMRSSARPVDRDATPRLRHPECVDAIESLLEPAELLDCHDVLGRPSRVAAVPGLYAWYFRTPPPGVPTTGCHTHPGPVLLYVGISPKAPPRNGSHASRQSVRSRLQYHYRGNAEGESLRV